MVHGRLAPTLLTYKLSLYKYCCANSFLPIIKTKSSEIMILQEIIICLLKFRSFVVFTNSDLIQVLHFFLSFLWFNCRSLYHGLPGSLYAICKAHHLKIGGLLGWHARSHANINLHMQRNNFELKNALAQFSFPYQYLVFVLKFMYQTKISK